jgi:hypothetical protein
MPDTQKDTEDAVETTEEAPQQQGFFAKRIHTYDPFGQLMYPVFCLTFFLQTVNNFSRDNTVLGVITGVLFCLVFGFTMSFLLNQPEAKRKWLEKKEEEENS